MMPFCVALPALALWWDLLQRNRDCLAGPVPTEHVLISRGRADVFEGKIR